MEQIIRPAFIHRLKNIISSANDLLILANEKDTENSCLKEDIFIIKGMVDQMCVKNTIAEVVHDYTQDETNLTYIDAYFVEDDGEVGMTVAVVCRDTGKVIAYGEGGTFILDPLVQEAIKEVLKEITPPTAICITCGTTHSNPENAYCVNGHDDWVQEEDKVLYPATWRRAMKSLNLTSSQLTVRFKPGKQ